jgi:hypothetical protein
VNEIVKLSKLNGVRPYRRGLKARATEKTRDSVSIGILHGEVYGPSIIMKVRLTSEGWEPMYASQ